MKPGLRLILAMMALLAATRSFAYQVELSTFFATSNSAVFLNTWSNVAVRADMLSADHGAIYTPAEDPEIPDLEPSTAQWQAIFAAIPSASHAEGGEFARSAVSRDPTITNALAYSAITNLVAGVFTTASQYGYNLVRLMFYDNAVAGTNYNWTTTEVQYMRDWLDNNGYTNVQLGYDARNNQLGVRSWCANPLVQFVLLEAGASGWFSNAGARQTLLPWLYTNPVTAGKPLVFQVVVDGIPDAYGPTNNFMYTRQFIQWLGGTLMGYDFLRSSNVIFKPITYNGPQLQWSPEMATPNGYQYTNTVTAVTLSLIEQRAFLEGRTAALPTVTDAYNFARAPYPLISPLANQTVNANTSSAALPFSVGSLAVAPAALAVTAYSSNPFLVADSNIVLQTWNGTDLGNVGVPGSNTLGDVITMNASGADISGAADAGRFIYQSLAGDGAMKVRVTNLPPVNAWSKAGVMMRLSTNAGSVNCFMHVSASDGVEFSWRSSDNGGTSSNVVAGIQVPCWLKLARTGTNFAGYYALDHAGSPATWTQVGSTVGIIGMNSNLLAGLAGTSHNNATQVTAIFDNISGNTNRNLVITPMLNQAGVAAINLTVSDGWYSSNETFTVTVPLAGGAVAPTISLPTNAVTLHLNGSSKLNFTVGDPQVPVGLLLLAGDSENTNLIPNGNLVFGGSGASRTVTITPAANQTGAAIINLGVSDGTNSAGATLRLTVLPQPDIFPAVTAGPINDTNTWGVPLPLPGDTNVWQTGSYTITMVGEPNTETFNGGTFDIQAGGAFEPEAPTVTLTLNNLILDGGLIYMGNNQGLTMNLSGQTFTLNGGTIEAGLGSGGRNVKFAAGSLAGSGAIYITGATNSSSPAAGYVQFESTINPANFSGVFEVATNGTLYLPAISSDHASFGLNVSGNGFYYNNTAVALTSLVINGMNIPPGTYTYASFTPAQQALIGNNGGTLTVVNSAPALAPIPDQSIIAGQTLTLTNVATDVYVPPQTLTFGLQLPPPGMTINANTGVLTWRPTIAQASAVYVVTVTVANNGSPSLSATNTYNLTVNPPNAPVLSGLNLANGGFSFTVNGSPGPDYIVLTSSNLVTWLPLQTNYSPAVPFSFAASNSVDAGGQFYQIQLGP